jgi:hypothetical protein
LLFAISYAHVKISEFSTHREWTLANKDEGPIDEADTLSRALQRLALGGENLDVFNNLGRRCLRHDRDAEGQGRGQDGAERNHVNDLVE